MARRGESLKTLLIERKIDSFDVLEQFSNEIGAEPPSVDVFLTSLKEINKEKKAQKKIVENPQLLSLKNEQINSTLEQEDTVQLQRRRQRQ